MTALRSLSDLKTLFGPEAKAQDNKKGAAAEAGRRKEVAMLSNIQCGSQIGNAVSERHTDIPASPLALIRDGAVRLTAAQAGAILRLTRYERQTRDLNPAGRDHILVLKDIMVRDQWRPFDKLDFANLDGKLILINGHHRLGAQAASGKVVTWMVVVHRCDSAQEVASLYYSFDTNVRGRSNQVILNAAGTADRLGLGKTITEALYRAAPVLAANFDFSRIALDPVVNRVVDRRIEIMAAFQREAQAWQDAIKKAPKIVKRPLLNQGAVAVAITTFKHCPEKAEPFWRGVADDNGLRKNDPRKTYLTAIQNSAATNGSGAYTARQAAVAWNAWYEGRSLSIIRIIENAPLRILGTPIGR